MGTSEANKSHGEWVQYYQRNLPSGSGGTAAVFGRARPLAESTVVTVTTTITTVSPAAASGGSAQPASEGPVGKAGRRRPRASRKAPTTLVDTDPANFRAIVQQYTGVPPGPFQGSGYPQQPTTLRFGLPQLQQQQPAGLPFGVQQQQFLQYPQHHERPPFTLGGGGNGDVFVQGYGFGGGDPTRGDMGVSDGYLLESKSSSSSSSQMSSSGCRTSNGFLF